MKVELHLFVSSLLLLAVGMCNGCNRRPPAPKNQFTDHRTPWQKQFGRGWMKYDYHGDSPEEILAKIKTAKYIEEIIAGLDALAVIGIHYKSSDNYDRALKAIMEVYELSQTQWKTRPIPFRDPPDPGFSDYDYWKKHNWTFRDVVASKVFMEVSGIATSYKEDQAFQNECLTFFESIRPPETKPELLRRWKYDYKVLTGKDADDTVEK